MIGIARNGMPQTDPPQTFVGPMVTLINEFSASDGDIFPYRFKRSGSANSSANAPGAVSLAFASRCRSSTAVSSSNRNSRSTQKTANNGSSKATESIPTSLSIMNPGKNSRRRPATRSGAPGNPGRAEDKTL